VKSFRNVWKAEYLGGFATPSMTHDNCTGKYPICFYVWDLAKKQDFPASVHCDIFNEKEQFEGIKTFFASEYKTINDWINKYQLSKETIRKNSYIGAARCDAPDYQRNIYCWIALQFNTRHALILYINKENFGTFAVYFAVRHSIEHKWINDCDQYFEPKDCWKEDAEFQNDCVIFTLFHSYNKIKLREGVNHWIPFTEDEVGSTARFESRFMSDFLKGLRGQGSEKLTPAARAVLDAGRELWRYYIQKTKTDANACLNASFYDIREYFQGTKENGSMNPKSRDETYNTLIGALRDAQKALAAKIEPKVYEYGFLKG
jgi:hypothetical protein